MTTAMLALTAALAMQAPARHAAPSAETSAPAAQAAAQTATPPSADDLAQAYLLFIQGREAEGRDDLTAAVADYRQALQAMPGAAEIHAQLADVFARDGKTDQAVTEAQAALAIDPTDREANRTLGLIQAQQAESLPGSARTASIRKEAIGHLEVVASDRTVDLDVELTLGRLYVASAAYPEAVQALQKFLLDVPDYAPAVILLAQVYQRTDRVADAIAVLQALVADDPTETRAWSWLAQLHEQAHAWKDAAGDWAELAKRDPDTVTYRTRQAADLANGGDVPAARQVLDEVTKASPTDIAPWYVLSQIERRAGNAAAAEAAARHIVAIDATDPRGPLALADAKAAGKDWQGVVDTLSPVVAEPRAEDVASGSYGEMVTRLANAYQQLHEDARATALLDAAAKRDPKNVAIMFDLADAYQSAKAYDRAEQTYRDLLAADPKNAEALNDFGYMLADRGQQLDEAVQMIQQAVAIEPDNPNFQDSLGWALFKEQKFGDARAPLERAAAALPTVSVIQDHVAHVYFELKMYREAAAAWDKALAGDRNGIDAADVTKHRDQARTLATP